MTYLAARLRRAPRNGGLCLAAVAALAFTPGCANRLVTNSIQKGIEARLPELIGPARSYEVEVQGSTRQMMRGRLRQVAVKGIGVRVMPDLCLHDLDVLMKDLVADPDTSVVKSVGEVRFGAVISEDALNEYLRRTRGDGISAQLLDGRMVVGARAKLLRFSTDVRVTGRLIPKGGKLDFEVDRLAVAEIETPSIAAEVLESRINPVLDLRSARFSPELISAAIVPGAIRISGTARLVGAGRGRGSTGD